MDNMSCSVPSPPYGSPDPTVRSHIGRSAAASVHGVPTATCAVCSTTLYEGMVIQGYARTGDDVRDIAVACDGCAGELHSPASTTAQYEEFRGVLVPNTVFTGFEFLYVDTSA